MIAHRESSPPISYTSCRAVQWCVSNIEIVIERSMKSFGIGRKRIMRRLEKDHKQHEKYEHKDHKEQMSMEAGSYSMSLMELRELADLARQGQVEAPHGGDQAGDDQGQDAGLQHPQE